MSLEKVTASGTTRQIGDQSFEFRPLTLKDYGTLQRRALDDFKQRHLETYRKNIDLFPEADRVNILREVIEQASKMDETDLPARPMMLDADEEVTIDPDKCVTKQFVEYPHWWFSFTYTGRLHAIWLSMRKAQPELTLDEVEDLLMDDEDSIESLANVVGDLSNPSVGNGQPPVEPAEDKGGRRKKRSTGPKSSTPSATPAVSEAVTQTT